MAQQPYNGRHTAIGFKMTKHLDEIADAVRDEHGFVVKHPQVVENVTKAALLKAKEIMLRDKFVVGIKRVYDSQHPLVTDEARLKNALTVGFDLLLGGE